MRILSLILGTLLLLGTAWAYKSYAGYQVLRTATLDASSIKRLAPFVNRDEFDFLVEPRIGRPADIMVSPELVNILKANLERLDLQPTVLIPDVGVVVAKERAEIEALRRTEKLQGRAPALDRYLTWDEIQAYLDEVVTTYPNIASLITIGSSYEGRSLRVLKLSNGPGKTGIWFDGAIHAREWIGPPTILHTINELTENLANNQAILDSNDFYFLPVSNADGYDYTWTNDRFWRKTRKPNSGSNCAGTDPNRNFDFSWAAQGQGSPCSETYAGTAPFSESETTAMSDFLLANPSITFYVAVHSYGPLLLYPWGDRNALPPNVADLERVANEAADALAAVRGTQYVIGSTANALYFAYGISTDWAYSVAGTPMSFTIELPPGGSGAFDPPPSDIGPVTTETWEAYKVFFANIPTSRFRSRTPRN